MSRNLKVISICDRSYNSYERSEAKIFIIWAIIKCPMIDQGGLWVIILLSFDVPSIIYLLLYIQEQNLKVILAYDRSYNSYERSEAKIFIIWVIIKCHMIDHKMSYDWSEHFVSDCSFVFWCTPYNLSFTLYTWAEILRLFLHMIDHTTPMSNQKPKFSSSEQS